MTEAAICRTLGRRLRSALVASLVSAFAWPPHAASATDLFHHHVVRSAPAPGRVLPQFSYFFGGPARWPQALRWQYNNANAPGELNLDEAEMVQLLANAAAKWTAVCGVDIVYDGPTTALPAATVNGNPDRTNVIGWQPPESGAQAATSIYSDPAANGGQFLVDADILLSPALIATPDLLATLVTHEWGHAIGLGHSSLDLALMSGPPDSAYSNLRDLTPDDVQGCRCLYGLPANLQEGYICSLPSKIDFGNVTIGASSPPRRVDVTNAGTASMKIGSLQLQGAGFVFATNSCAFGMTLAPGSSCAVDIAGTPSREGLEQAELILNASTGPHRIPLAVTGTVAPPPPLNFEGAWWNAPPGSEDGWGLTLAHQDDAIFTTWFTYGEDGKALWLSMTAFRVGNGNVFSGTLYRTTGPPLTVDPFPFGAVQYVAVGTATLSFADADHGTFAYTIDNTLRTKPLARFSFGPLPTCTFAGADDPARDHKFEGNWWTAGGTESGWGLYLAHQGDVIFVGWFTYDANGTPSWLSATTNRISETVYQGDVIRSSGPPFSAVPFESAGISRSPVGNMTLAILDESHVSFSYSVRLGNAASSISGTKLLEPLIFRPPGTRCQQ